MSGFVEGFVGFGDPVVCVHPGLFSFYWGGCTVCSEVVFVVIVIVIVIVIVVVVVVVVIVLAVIVGVLVIVFVIVFWGG